MPVQQEVDCTPVERDALVSLDEKMAQDLESVQQNQEQVFGSEVGRDDGFVADESE